MTLAWSLVTFALADWPSMAATGILGLFRFGGPASLASQCQWHSRIEVVGPAVEANGARQRTVLVLCFVLFFGDTLLCHIFSLLCVADPAWTPPSIFRGQLSWPGPKAIHHWATPARMQRFSTAHSPHAANDE